MRSIFSTVFEWQNVLCSNKDQTWFFYVFNIFKVSEYLWRHIFPSEDTRLSLIIIYLPYAHKYTANKSDHIVIVKLNGHDSCDSRSSVALLVVAWFQIVIFLTYLANKCCFPGFVCQYECSCRLSKSISFSSHCCSWKLCLHIEWFRSFVSWPKLYLNLFWTIIYFSSKASNISKTAHFALCKYVRQCSYWIAVSESEHHLFVDSGMQDLYLSEINKSLACSVISVVTNYCDILT